VLFDSRGVELTLAIIYWSTLQKVKEVTIIFHLILYRVKRNDATLNVAYTVLKI
jgi:hypothetical protein